MPNKFGAPEHWDTRAQEARRVASSVQDSDAKRAIWESPRTTNESPSGPSAKEAGVLLHPDGHLSHDS
jgi:hypothetical protein